MENLNPTLVILVGLILRLAVPLALTLLIVYLLRKLDARWQTEARIEQKAPSANELPCLEIQSLSDDQINARISLSTPPCWQVRRLPNGYLNEACLDCEVFLNASKPSTHSHAHI